MSQFDLKFEHIPGKRNVADYLSRIPGAELLQEDQVCSSAMTLGVLHFCDVIAGDAQQCEDLEDICHDDKPECSKDPEPKTTKVSQPKIEVSNVITVFEDSSLLKTMKRE